MESSNLTLRKTRGGSTHRNLPTQAKYKNAWDRQPISNCCPTCPRYNPKIVEEGEDDTDLWPTSDLVNTNLIRAYHATSTSIGSKILNSQQLEPSTSECEWLGHGIYFWEDNIDRAIQWGQNHRNKEISDAPFLIVAELRVSRCFDMQCERFQNYSRKVFGELKVEFNERNRSLPENKNGCNKRDCLVFNQVIGKLSQCLQTIRAVYPEGNEIFPGCAIRHHNHIQINVVDASCISIVDGYALERKKNHYG